MDVRDATEGQFGDVLAVLANPIKSIGNYKTVGEMINVDTVTFMFPLRQEFINKLVSIGNGGGIWTPNMNDFKASTVREENTILRKTMYYHVSFWDLPFDRTLNSENSVSLIPDMRYKIKQFHQQYYRNGWYDEYSFVDYVASLAEEDNDTHFWNYLFNTHEFDGYSPYSLPPEYFNEYKTFLSECSAFDNNI